MLDWFVNPLGVFSDVLGSVLAPFATFLVGNPIFYTIFALWVLIVVCRLVMEVIG